MTHDKEENVVIASWFLKEILENFQEYFTSCQLHGFNTNLDFLKMIFLSLLTRIEQLEEKLK